MKSWTPRRRDVSVDQRMERRRFIDRLDQATSDRWNRHAIRRMRANVISNNLTTRQSDAQPSPAVQITRPRAAAVAAAPTISVMAAADLEAEAIAAHNATITADICRSDVDAFVAATPAPDSLLALNRSPQPPPSLLQPPSGLAMLKKTHQSPPPLLQPSSGLAMVKKTHQPPPPLL